MTPAEYMETIALPTALEFNRNRRSRRLGYLACITAFHVKDYLAAAGETGVDATMRKACTVDTNFAFVQAICTAAKHTKADGENRPVRLKAGDDRDQPPGIWGEAKWGVSFWGDPIGGRVVPLPSGDHDIYQAVKDVLDTYGRTYPGHFVGCDFQPLWDAPAG
jgi:hypothetical protein